MEHVNDIKVRINNSWVPAKSYQIEGINMYDSQYVERIIEYNKDGYKFSIGREANNPYNCLYLIREDGTKLTIVNLSNIKVFLVNHPSGSNWYEADDNLKYYYLNYIYANQPLMNFSNIIIGRNDNNSIYYQNGSEMRIRISDNTRAQSGYLGFFRRVTDDIPYFISPPSNNDSVGYSNSTNYLPIPSNVFVNKTDNDEIMCCICNINAHNIKFLPCAHTNTCSECYLKLNKTRTCPFCRQLIEEINSYNP